LTDAAAWPPASRGWYATAVLTLAYVLSFVDRQILTLLVAPIQRDLDLSDTQMSLLIGAAFAICYTTFGLPLGWVVDRVSRRRVAAWGVAFWSVMTAACGAAGTFAQLFVARMGVGLGEAALTPAAYSLLSDSFPPAKLVRAIGVYMSGAILGIAFAYALGGQIAAWIGSHDSVALPLVGTVRGWQAPFFVLLLPGLLLAVLIAAIPEPPRRKPPGAAASVPPLLPFLRSRAGTYGLLFLAMGAQSVVVYANLSWMPTLMARRFGWDAASIGYALGAIFLVAGLGGNFFGAWIGGRLLAAGRARAYLGVCVASAGLLLLVGPVGPVMGTAAGVLGFLVPTILLTSIPTAIVPAAVQLTTPGEYRGRISAVYLFATQMLGLSLGPTTVALFTDYVFADRAAIGSSQAAAVALASAVSLAAFVAARTPFARLAATAAD